MSLINREALLSFEKMDADLCATCGEHHTAEDVIMMIKTAPTVDAVPVVRCRECKNYVIVDEFEGGKRYMCLVNHFSYLDNDGDNQFCSYGERKEGADNG